ncbi:MAG: 3-oxoacyl-ACP reductase FabG [Gammaproteobacteria bacterium]|uniref:3-oxoacyl-ACP reductase FabG n=1 Tax=Limnobacter sp. TaxID=2003368 RepID=UPI001D407E24|nr:3-oxoacyl-ACP reductase FabG [Limnobacter sp.]MBU0783173.1 3-oxoacyl-ACP reductase FabG [Gammaproteobacteria bacterium]MBU0849760.1 3-oxoacyl-ACP reductase FabG [Gammaproteobacteria bacterium]MBU1266210.1 3-oxoacyl-ACP reductase FabG [Gammaproteobacteria bacterium]MBU1529401.1 3-oxoacyl-ACP reductase FabG [Gammaproteobacteria bacterium]MBU1779219.1 3-oxoacyl-ACP reductase FabG [Gammaproteobacteria bacterium]
MSLFDLTGKIALVTGASRGIGREIAITLGKAGATVVGTATSEAGAADITAGLNAAGVKGFGAVLNVTDSASLEPLFARIAEELGPLSILVNNAGITRDQLAMRMKDDDWDAVIATNLSSVFKLSKLAMKPMMKARTGRMINITSVVGTSGNAGQANYAAAKAGVAGMTKALARELGSRNITVNCVAPGFIQTDMTDALSETQVDQLKQQIPLGRMGQVTDIAAAVLYLASDQAGYVTGTTLHVNGGMWMG